ncbi:MAG: ATP-dependent DNA helicase UvrD2 [Flaviflexus sp.]|nr:ATP-dependent DNA helicase UvrD2 [Flaviflexus sp.]
MDDLLDALDPDQREVALHPRGPMVVRAGAGTGKTRAITYRIAYGVKTGAYHPHNVLAVTFTQRAAGEMRSRLRDLGIPSVQAHTFHAAARRQLHYFWPHAVGGVFPQLQEHKAPLVSQAAASLGMRLDRASLRDLSSEIEWAKVGLISIDEYPERARAAGRLDVGGQTPENVGKLLAAYEEAKSARGVIDFEDMLLILNGILVERPDIAAQIRHQYRYFVVDEYQDVSPLQQRLLELWLGERNDLCVVGDVSQTIYSFTGANPRYLRDFHRRFKGAREVHLVRDYRSTPQVVDLANRVIEPGRLPGSVKLTAQRPSGPAVGYTDYDDDESEAAGIAKKIARLAGKGTALSEIAVLVRTNSQIQEFEQALGSAGISFTIRGGERFFQRTEIREAMVAFRSMARSGVEDTLTGAVTTILGQLGWEATAPGAPGARRERWEALNALVALAEDMEEARGADLTEFVAELEERASLAHTPTVEGVTLASLHAAKGLEWDAVFLAGLSEGLMPISHAEGAEAIEEERRLLYVGITRAREVLELSYAKSRRASGRSNRRPTRFLDGMWPSTEKISRATATRRRSKEAHRRFAEQHPEDQGIFNDLRAWRTAQAADERRPAYQVLTDVVLMNIAVQKPADLHELGRVKGIGMTKLDRYGQAILDVLASRHS